MVLPQAVSLLLVVFVVDFPTVVSRVDQPVVGVVAVPIGEECITAWEISFNATTTTISSFTASGPITSPTTPTRDKNVNGVAQSQRGSCFHSLYVQWLESAGARVVPIPYDVSETELDHLLQSVNGVLFTGGEVELHNLTSPYMNTARQIVERSVALAKEQKLPQQSQSRGVGANDEQDNDDNDGTRLGQESLPIWGTCMGFQTLIVLAANDPSILTEGVFDSEGLALPLNVSAEGRRSRLWKGLRPHVQETLSTKNVTCNLHHDGVFAADFAKSSAVTAEYELVSTNVDRRQQRFVSTMEHRFVSLFPCCCWLLVVVFCRPAALL